MMLRTASTRPPLRVAITGLCHLLCAIPALAELIATPSNFAAKGRFGEVASAIEQSNAKSLAGQEHVAGCIDRHRPAIEASLTHAEFADRVNRLISDIGLSHFRYYADEDWQYWLLYSTFIDTSEGGHVTHAGIIPERIDDRWFVRGVLEGGPADGKNLMVGDELLTVDGMPYSPVRAFRGTAGKPVELRVSRRPGHVHVVKLKPKKESLHVALVRAMEKSVRTVSHGEHTFAYLHGWTLLGGGKEYSKLLRIQDDVDGLLLDYRDGFGGVWHIAEQFLLGADGRGSTSDTSTWTKPVVMLTGPGTRSAKEIVAYKVKAADRAPLVGEPTPGHVISVGGIKSIGDDGLLMLPGMRFDLEGRPIIPDFLIERDIRYAGGADSQMEFARDLLGSMVQREAKGLTGSWDDAALALPNVSRAP